MKKGKLFLGLALASMLALTGCVGPGGGGGGGGGGQTGDDIYVTVVDAGFGSGWMEDLADAYYEETGVTVYVASDPQLINGVETKMGTTAAKDDIYFVAQGQSNWLKWTTQDLIEPLDEVLTSDKYGTPAADRYRESGVLTQMGVFDGTSYLMPYLYSMWGLVYRQDYLDRVDSFGSYVKGEFPTTMQGLIDLCTAVKNAAITNPRTGRTVSPFSAGLTVNYMDYMFFSLWNEADPAGYAAYWGQTDRSAYDGSGLDTAGALGAMETMFDLIGAESATSSNLVSGGQRHLEAQTSFVNGDCVFTFSGTWFESEMTLLIGSTGNTDYHFAAFPSAKGEGTLTSINLPGEYLFIPSDAENVEGAKDFLTFILSEKGIAVAQRSLSQQTVFTTDEQVTLTTFGQEIQSVADSAEKCYQFAKTDIFMTGALRLFEQETNPFYAMGNYQVTSKGDIRANCITTELTKKNQRWKDYMDLLTQLDTGR